MIRLTVEQVTMILLLNNQLDENGVAFGSRRIAAIMGCNYSTVCRWINRWERERRVHALKPIGRPRKTTEEQDCQIVALSIVMRFANLTELLAQLPEIHVCKATFISRLREHGLKFRIAAKKERLTDGNRINRIQMANENLNLNLEIWQKVIFLDEASIESTPNGQFRVIRFKGTRYDNDNIVASRT